jgi:hypothetical protein
MIFDRLSLTGVANRVEVYIYALLMEQYEIYMCSTMTS